MKSKIFLLMLISILFFGVFSGVLTEICNAEGRDYNISIEDTTYEVIKIDDSKATVVVYYKISIVLHNSGNKISDDITLEMNDAFGVYLRNGTILPGGSREFVFDDWPLMGLGEHLIDISFYPTDLNIPREEYNSGSTSLVLSADSKGDDKSTPGFEIILVITAIIVITFLGRKR